jgi:hypothetical protein
MDFPGETEEDHEECQFLPAEIQTGRLHTCRKCYNLKLLQFETARSVICNSTEVLIAIVLALVVVIAVAAMIMHISVQKEGHACSSCS